MPIDIDYVLTDRARVHRKVLGARVRGESQEQEYISGWFKCRITRARGQERRSLEGRKGVERTHRMITKLVDVTGTPINFVAGDTVEGEESLNAIVFTPVGEFEIVEPPRKARSLVEDLLWTVSMRQNVDTPERDAVP